LILEQKGMKMLDQNWNYQVADTMQLAYLTRAGLIESRHHGIAALTGPDGKLISQYGNARKLIYPRSAVKPLQTVAMQRAGFNLEGELLAIATASHQGTIRHQQLVIEVLESAGLSEKHLLCPVAWPGNAEARKTASSETRLAFNCSGKHAGFLATCVKNNWDTKSYLEPEHPLQLLVKEVIEEFSGEKIPHSTADGCGAPLHAMSVIGLARAIGKFAATEIQIATAMKDNGWVIDDVAAQDSLFLDLGMVAKIGAEGVFVVGLDSGHAVALKIADGSLRPAGLIAAKILFDHELIAKSVFDELFEALALKINGGNQIVGSLEVAI
jgi:L-asparaginase II